MDGYLFGCKSIFSYKMRQRSFKERCLSSRLLATVLLKHLAARPPAQWILLSVCIILFGLKRPGVTYSVLNFYSCLVNLIFFKDSSSDTSSSSWSVVPSCPWLLCLSHPARLLVLCTFLNFQNAASSPPNMLLSTAGLPDIALTYSKTNLQRKHLAALIKPIS